MCAVVWFPSAEKARETETKKNNKKSTSPPNGLLLQKCTLFTSQTYFKNVYITRDTDHNHQHYIVVHPM